MKQWIPILLAMVLFVGCAKNETGSYRQIDAEQAAIMMEQESDYLILDVRTQEEYEQGHIPHAVNLPNEWIQKGEVAQLGDTDRLLLVYCRSGNRSKQAAETLAEMGYTNVVEFGGINDWNGEILVSEP